jgi:hypothetical protein
MAGLPSATRRGSRGVDFGSSRRVVISSPSPPTPFQISEDFCVIQFRVTGGETGIDGESRLAVRLEMIGHFIEEMEPGTYATSGQVPRKTIAADFGSPEQARELAARIAAGVTATGMGTDLISQDDVPREKVVDDLLVNHTNVQFAHLPEGGQPVMRLTFTGFWMNDLLDLNIDRPAKRVQACLFLWNMLLLAAQLDAEARRLEDSHAECGVFTSTMLHDLATRSADGREQ